MKNSKLLSLALLFVAMVFVSCDKNDDTPEDPKPDYAREIIGAWDGVALNGSSKYAEGDSRLVFYADSTCVMYERYGDVWYYSDWYDENYTVEDGILTLRWRPDEDEEFCEESWQIADFGDDKMTWTNNSLLSGNQTIASTFNWKKSDKPSDERIASDLVGSWHALTRTWRTIGKNREVVSVEVEDMTKIMNSVHTFRKDGTTTMYENDYADPEDPESENEITIIEGTYFLDHDIIYFEIERDGVSRMGWNIVYDVNDKNLTTIMYAYTEGRSEEYVVTVLWERVDEAPMANTFRRSNLKNHKETAAGLFFNSRKMTSTTDIMKSATGIIQKKLRMSRKAASASAPVTAK